MSADPRECRERALECMKLARNAKTPEHKQRLIDLAQNWVNLAIEVERAQALLEGHLPPHSGKPN